MSNLTQYDILKYPGQPNPDPGTNNKLYLRALFTNSTHHLLMLRK